MSLIADLHLHSKYSRAVSQKMDLREIAFWAKKKGINLVGIPDWTHPLFFREIKENLIEKNEGVFILKNHPQFSDINFIFSTEVSLIYSQGDKQRRIHTLILSPSIEVCEKVIKKLQDYGANLLSDGRPILGISAKDLLSLLLEIDQRILLIPCHIWTPWFSLYGSKSGFDSIDEAFGELSSYVYAVETGLSSDPIMNWQIKELETRAIVSFSDAHSGQKLGREATVFITNKTNKTYKTYITYSTITNALKQNPNAELKIGYTIEFFPEEGKYHWSGHRQCNIRLSPDEVKKNGKICPVCQKPLTIGVENRVVDLSYKILKKEDLIFVKNKYDLTFVLDKEKKHLPFVSLVPLMEILNEIYHSPKKVSEEYEKITASTTEFEFLMKTPYEDIEKIAGKKLRQAIEIVRQRRVFVDPGYDGVFGVVKIFQNHVDEKNEPINQQRLF
ncbi:MAG: endonuclease Q family protein [Minisyncoccia bacterium]